MNKQNLGKEVVVGTYSITSKNAWFMFNLKKSTREIPFGQFFFHQTKCADRGCKNRIFESFGIVSFDDSKFEGHTKKNPCSYCWRCNYKRLSAEDDDRVFFETNVFHEVSVEEYDPTDGYLGLRLFLKTWSEPFAQFFFRQSKCKGCKTVIIEKMEIHSSVERLQSISWTNPSNICTKCN